MTAPEWWYTLSHNDWSARPAGCQKPQEANVLLLRSELLDMSNLTPIAITLRNNFEFFKTNWRKSAISAESVSKMKFADEEHLKPELGSHYEKPNTRWDE